MVIQGNTIAKEIISELKIKVIDLKKKGITPHLLIILIGDDASSISYINQKIKKGNIIGIKTTLKKFTLDVLESTVLNFIDSANYENNIHGIIIQRPVPPQIDSLKLNLSVIPEKDVDGFHPKSKFVQPIALTVMTLLEKIHNIQSNNSFKEWLFNKNIVIIGRGEAGGKPVISYFTKFGIPHSVIHSQTKNNNQIIEKADIVISAVGNRGVIKKEFLKQNVILIGIGLHKNNGFLKGDYDENEIHQISSFYTPTPGGVGPINVSMLLSNLVKASTFK